MSRHTHTHHGFRFADDMLKPGIYVFIAETIISSVMARKHTVLLIAPLLTVLFCKNMNLNTILRLHIKFQSIDTENTLTLTLMLQ